MKKKPTNPFQVRRARTQPSIQKPDVYGKPTPKNIAKLVARAKAISRQLDEVKPLYNELDQITFALNAVKERLATYGVAVVDNFEAKNTMFKTVGMRRYDLKWTYRGGE